MADQEGGNKEFTAFLKARPTLNDVTSGRVSTLTGQVFRSDEGKVAVTLGDGRTLELDAGAIEHFKIVDGSGPHPIVALTVSSEAVSKAVLKPVKIPHKEIAKDPIKDLIADHKHVIKDFHTDPAKDLGKDGIKDPILDPVGTLFRDPQGGTGAADVMGGDPFGQGVNPAAGMAAGAAQAFTPFVMATPHHAPAHLIAMQAGVPAMPQAAAAAMPQPKPFAGDWPKPIWRDTVKELSFDTHKEMIIDTRKELYETLVEPGPSWQEATFDPTGAITQPVWGFPGLMY